MKPKSVKITYWILVSLLCLFMAADAYGGLTKAKQGVDELSHLGYASYIMPMFGVMKVLGIIALLQIKYSRIKEWVFAGLVFIFIGAFVSHIAVKDPVINTIFPLIFVAFTLVVRMFWIKYHALLQSNN